MRDSAIILQGFSNGRHIRAVEVGVRHGKNAVDMLANWDNLFLFLVDNYKKADCPDAKAEMLNGVLPFSSRCKFIEKESTEASKDFEDNSLDYVYIDAGHTYDDVINDLNAWCPKVKIGGMVAGHDYWVADVRKAVNDFLTNREEGLCPVHREGRTQWDWFFIRRK